MALRFAGGHPVRISANHGTDGHTFDALIIGGGSDIGPEHYGGDIDSRVRADPDRDRLEIAWIERALANRTPLLGICRGAQLINVVLGGDLHQDIRGLRKHTRNRASILATKTVRLGATSALSRICNRSKVRVNSLHHQAVRELGRGLAVVGRDADAIVQAVESSEGDPVIGVQWHPEYLFYLPAQFALFRWLVRAAA